MEYKHLERYGLIGNLETCALVGDDGAIDWFCVPHVESSSIFARILDAEIGGHFTVQPSEAFNSHQQYLTDTNVLQTLFQTASGRATVTDFMPIAESDHDVPTDRAIYRRIAVEEGHTGFRIEFVPAFDYATATPRFERRENTIVAVGRSLEIAIDGVVPGRIDQNGVVSTQPLSAGEEQWLRLSFGSDRTEFEKEPEAILDDTIQYWRRWVHDCDDPAKCNLRGPWHEYAVRSGLVLKLLTHRESGAICAAPTTSLPEEIGGTRNWDYRYNWLRDAAFTTQALYKLGHEREALEYLDWLIDICQTIPPAEMQPLYGLHGPSDLTERTLTHLDGYRGSRPVRIGNASHGQLQLDIYGELMDAIFETTRYGTDIPVEAWQSLREIVNYVCTVWKRPDSGIWEIRSEPRHFVYSKVMCWVALDRGIQLVENTAFDGDAERWRAIRDEIRRSILTDGYNESIGSFVRSFESENTLDATSLLIPLRGLLPFDDHRVQGTIDATLDRLTTDEGFVYRYEGSDGLSGEEGAFLLCSFWLVDALTLSERLEEAAEIFETVAKYVTPLGLLAEEIDPETGRQLGNFPQAFSHIGLVNSAVYLTYAAGIEQPGPEPHGTERRGTTSGRKE